MPTIITAVLAVSPGCYAELKERLVACGGQDRVQRLNFPTEGSSAENVQECLVLGDLALKAETDERVKVWLIYDGRKINA